MHTFTITHTDPSSRARTGSFKTAHGPLQTPNLAVVATDATIRCLDPGEIGQTPIDYSIANTFHIWAKDILPRIEEAGGIHQYMGYNHVMATDSGGFQVFSLGFGVTHGTSKLGAIFPFRDGHVPTYNTSPVPPHDRSAQPDQNTTTAENSPDATSTPAHPAQSSENDTNNPVTITEEGATFPFAGKTHTLTPERSMEIQHRIGADIIFAFDECTSSLNSKEYTRESMHRTHRWLDRCIAAHAPQSHQQALFGIVQGGAYRDLREESARYLAQADVPGYGIGGSLGTIKDDMHEILDWTLPLLPENRPRHLLGIGSVPDIFASVRRGIDLFDCVIPTREARHRILYTMHGRIAVRVSRATDEIIDPRPGSPTAPGSPLAPDGVTFAQLARWFQTHDPRARWIATHHNIFFFTQLMKDIRQAIAEDRLDELEEAVLQHWD